MSLLRDSRGPSSSPTVKMPARLLSATTSIRDTCLRPLASRAGSTVKVTAWGSFAPCVGTTESRLEAAVSSLPRARCRPFSRKRRVPPFKSRAYPSSSTRAPGNFASGASALLTAAGSVTSATSA
ncbi:hypothetical protein ACN28S_00835 [Cystobacter fuscus]